MSNHQSISNPEDFELHQGFLHSGGLFNSILVTEQSLSGFLRLIYKFSNTQSMGGLPTNPREGQI